MFYVSRPCLTQGMVQAECWLTISSGLSGGHSPGFSPLRRGSVCLAPEGPLIRRTPTGPKVFLALPDACGLRPCDRTHIKNGLVPYFSGGGTENKYLSSHQPNTSAVRLTFNTFLSMLYYIFVNILCSS